MAGLKASINAMAHTGLVVSEQHSTRPQGLQSDCAMFNETRDAKHRFSIAANSEDNRM